MNARPLEHELLLLVARDPRATRPDARLRELLGRVLDWNPLLQLATRHALLPLLVRKLKGHVPDAVDRRLRAAEIAHVSHAMDLCAELLRIIDALERAGVCVMPFKGPVLAHQLYRNLVLRQFADLDLLVQPSDLLVAHEVLVQLGYQGKPLTPAQRTTVLRHGHCLQLARAPGYVVELHWRITGPVHPIALDLDRLWARAQPLMIGGHPVLAPSPCDLLPALCAHGAKHAWERLGWICDIAALVRIVPGDEWGGVLASAEQRGHLRVVLWGLQLAHALLEAPLPAAVHERLRGDARVAQLTDAAQARLFGAPVSKGRRHLLAYGAWQGWRNRLALLSGGLFSIGPADWNSIRVPERLHWLYAAWRPIRLLREHVLPPTMGGRGP
jgi:hypothetical protein